MRIVLTVLAVTLLQSCQPVPPPREVVKTWNVGARPLWDSYCDNDTKWTGERVRVKFPAEGYEVSPSEVHWHPGRNTDPPAIIFVTAKTPKDNIKTIVIEGVVKGPVIDGLDRGFRVNWHVRVEGCVVSAP